MSLQGTTLRQAAKDAEKRKKCEKYSQVLKGGGAGNYRIVFPIKDDDMIIGVAQTEILELTLPGQKYWGGQVVFDDSMQIERKSFADPPQDKTQLKSLARICKVIRNGEMNSEIAKVEEKFKQATGVDISEKVHEIDKIRDKYVYNEANKNAYMKDVVGRLRDVQATMAAVIKLDANNNMDKSFGVRYCYVPMVAKRMAAFLSILDIQDSITKDCIKVKTTDENGQEIEQTCSVLETQVTFKGATNKQELFTAMGELTFQNVPKELRIVNTTNAADIMKECPYSVEMMKAKIPLLSSGWSLERAVSEVQEYISKQAMLLKYATTDTDEYKYAEKDIAEYTAFDKIQCDVVSKAKANRSVAIDSDSIPVAPETPKEKEIADNQLETANDLASLF